MLEIEAESEDWYVCTCNDTCNDYLQWWWNAPMESLFNVIKPAHTKLVYSYTDGDAPTSGEYILTELAEPILSETGDNLVTE